MAPSSLRRWNVGSVDLATNGTSVFPPGDGLFDELEEIAFVAHGSELVGGNGIAVFVGNPLVAWNARAEQAREYPAHEVVRVDHGHVLETIFREIGRKLFVK